jgi:2-desacetyl-2-hydroxyethyl bacteriochlorophyllide A dehydrogenase
MRAFVIDKPGATSLIDVSEPAMGERDCLLRVRTAGLCGTDLSTFRGVNPLVSYPRIPGHELGCTIEAKGAAVPDEFRVGQNVLVHPYQNCGECSACQQGRPNCCRDNQTMGVQRDGGLTDLIAVPYDKLYTSEKLSLREMALVEPLTIGYHAVMRGRVAAGDTVGVFGCGAIGIGVIAAAAGKGATVIAIDVADEKLALARQVGAKYIINSSEDELHTALKKLTDRQGPRVMIEAVGLPATFRAAVEEAAFAGRVVYIGYSKQPVEYDTRHFVQRELDVMGSRNALADDFRAVIAYLESGLLPVDEVITKTVPLEDAGAALAAWDENPGAVCKIQVEL